jgi:protein SCO1/2
MSIKVSPIRVLPITVVLALAGCSTSSNTREYELHGQVLAVDPARQEITIKHGDIHGFMPGMTMPFKVRDRALIQGRVPGDLVKATLVLEETDAFLRTIEKTGSAPLTEPAPAPRVDVLGPGDTPPDVELVDESKLPRRLSAFRGQTVGVTFMYTRCPLPNFCPLMDRNFKTVQDRVLADPGLRGRVRLLSVTLDPEFDRPAVLAKRARSLGAVAGTWSFLTGERESVERFAGAFGVSIMRDDPAKQEVVHNLRTGVVRPDGTILTVISGNEWTPEQLVDELRKAVATK